MSPGFTHKFQAQSGKKTQEVALKYLMTGFEPFGESPLNPSKSLVESLPDMILSEVKLIKTVLPVDYKKGPETMLKLLNQHEPDAVFAFGLASGRAKISLERIAVNLLDFRIPDNSGKTITDQPVIPGGPTAYFTTLPIQEMLHALLSHQIPAECSLTAGAFLCNQVFYTLMHEIDTKDLRIPAGFIHLPALPEQAAESSKAVPSMSLPMEIRAVEILITQLLSHQKTEEN